MPSIFNARTLCLRPGDMEVERVGGRMRSLEEENRKMGV